MRIRPVLGRRARSRLELRLASLLSLSFAFCSVAASTVGCSDDDDAPAPQAAGGSSSVPLDASVRDLPGEGFEPTPDVDGRQREPIGPEQLVETIDMIRPNSDGTPRTPAAAPLDAGADGASDQDGDAGTN